MSWSAQTFNALTAAILAAVMGRDTEIKLDPKPNALHALRTSSIPRQ